MLAAAIILITLVPMTLMHVLAPPPPPPSAPEKLTEYGVVRVYASVLFTGDVKDYDFIDRVRTLLRFKVDAVSE